MLKQFKAVWMGGIAALGICGAAVAGEGGSAPTFNKEVVRIFQENCQNCHRTGVQFTPMSLESYAEARPHAKSIKKSVVDRKMPPWHADPQYGNFSNTLRMSDADVETISRWVDAGSPEGNPADLPPKKEFAEGWQIGKPDVIVDIGQDFEVPADGIVPYKFFSVKTDFGEDKFISAMEARAGNLDVVHHAVILVRNPKGGIEPPDPKGDMMGGTLLGALSPGNTPSIYPEGQGKLIKKGATIIFQMHYTTNGKAAKDRSYLGLKFHAKPVEKQVVTRGIANVGFIIPPYAEKYEVRSTHKFDKDVTLHRFMPHMHYRGKDFKYTAVFPDGREEVLLSVPNYDFDWQTYFNLVQPMKLPAGTKIDCVAHFDNTEAMAAGRRYFEPSKPVKFGEQSWEEMMIGWLDYTVDGENLTTNPPTSPVGSAPAQGSAAKSGGAE